mmetsp:Transcript_2530/g.5855  ORF Transcript_2530/g.5855 Transcript_2530/m.5855 type:complete len:483 (+) Transcript_2530:363-1811(+)|eukprot:CAMPEP_0171486134 /NCGR_PEP_ID=MMETSP0958-20121227/924_1 /TAXON_ID=87120 /ORGANISM="Aurantiochytrium limacinum, Strain ATCCMYA-1381" /LENGTH=482 /DNA_ID=CAMNT_0012018985 /DNA_START=237 /DNA_END=1685 /DNA_ORIENTATION=-
MRKSSEDSGSDGSFDLGVFGQGLAGNGARSTARNQSSLFNSGDDSDQNVTSPRSQSRAANSSGSIDLTEDDDNDGDGATGATGAGAVFAAGQTSSRRMTNRARRTAANNAGLSGASVRRRQQTAAESHRSRIYGSSAPGLAEQVLGGRGGYFRPHNTFAGLDPDGVSHESGVLQSILTAQRLPHYLTPGGAVFGAGGLNEERDYGDVWGKGDESDERMQQILADSHSLNRRTRASSVEEYDDNDEDLNAAIRASLETHTPPAPGFGLSADTASSRRVNTEMNSQLAKLEEEDLARALDLSTKLSADSAQLNQDIIDVQFASLVENHPEEIVMQTISIFDEMREKYEREGGTLPDVGVALEQAQKQVDQRKQREDLRAAIDSQFDEIADDYTPEELAEGRQIFEDLSKEMAESGGHAPTVDYAMSLAKDRAKSRLAEKQRSDLAEQNRQQAEQDRQAAERKQESRAERAARFAAAFERKKQTE